MDYRIEQLRYLLREDPSSRVFYQLGELLRRMGEPGEAVGVLTTGLERHPRYVAAWVSLGRSHRDLGKLADAASAFRTALDIDRENPVAARLLGETSVEREDWLQAVKSLKLARALSGGDDQLDARIALVEEHLARDGRLEPPRPRRPRPARPLEVVSLSAEDPFAAAADEVVTREPSSDVFEITEAPSEPDTVAEAEPELIEAPDEGEVMADRPPAPETPALDGAVEDEAATDAAPVREPVDEGSVGAWSASGPAVAAEAWREPTDELPVAVEAAVGENAWTEPGPPPPPEGTPETDGEVVAEPEPEAAPVDEAPAAVDQGPPPSELDEPEPASATIEATPAVVDDVPPPSETDEHLAEPAGSEAEASVGDDHLPMAHGNGESPAARRHELDHGVPLPTMTLARLALEQDDRQLAMATLENLIERDPGHAEALELLDRLRAEEQRATDDHLRAARTATKVAALQGWLEAVRLAAERRAQ